MNKGSIGLLGLLATFTILGGCGYGSSPPEIVKGRRFPVESAKSIDKGMTAARVRQILGDPLEIQPNGANERWHYFARERKEEVVYILGLIKKRNIRYIWDYDLTVKLKDQRVEAAEYRETKIR
jgi:outer membrane protein assembly factor BamE (lipoprotein component of BamABCDE complex)